MQARVMRLARFVMLTALLLETIGLVISTMFFISRVLTESVSSQKTFVAVSAILFLTTLWVGWSLIASWRGKNSAVSSTLTWQIIQIPVSFSLIQGGNFLFVAGCLGLALSLVTIAALYITRALNHGKDVLR